MTKKKKNSKDKVERADGKSQIKRCLQWRSQYLSREKRATHAAVHRDHADLQAADQGAALRSAAVRRGWSRDVRVGVRRGAEPQSPAGLLPQRSEPNQWEAAGKRISTPTATLTTDLYQALTATKFSCFITNFFSLLFCDVSPMYYIVLLSDVVVNNVRKLTSCWRSYCK